MECFQKSWNLSSQSSKKGLFAGYIFAIAFYQKGFAKFNFATGS